MPRIELAHDVVTAALDRYRRLYEGGHRVVVSCSGGKDSTVCVELAIMAAREAGRLPVEVVMRDEEVMLPGTFEYTERLANRVDEVDFHWIIAGQPIVNIFDRANPYFWVFDQTLDPEEWVRKWPGFDASVEPLAGRQPYWIATQHIGGICQLDRFPQAGAEEIEDVKGRIKLANQRAKDDKGDAWTGVPLRPATISIIGLRTYESPRRMLGLMSSRGYVTRSPNSYGIWEARPVYDWTDGDVWKFLHDFSIDYNHAYDVMYRMGIARQRLRIAPPTLTAAGLAQLQVASRAWPRWFDRVARRLKGVRTAAQFGKRSIEPYRRLGETWRQCFDREIMDSPYAPDWLKERAWAVAEASVNLHSTHAVGDFPDAINCPTCGYFGSWAGLAYTMWNGDPFAMKAGGVLKPIEPEFFRAGAGTWGGSVAFK